MRLSVQNNEKLVINGLSDEQSFSIHEWVTQRMAVALVPALFLPGVPVAATVQEWM